MVEHKESLMECKAGYLAEKENRVFGILNHPPRLAFKRM
jgi:hypothetical protein